MLSKTMSYVSVTNWGITTQYFKLEEITPQGGFISDFWFTLALEILFLLIKVNPHKMA